MKTETGSKSTYKIRRMYRRQKLDWESNLETIEEATPEAEEQDTPQTMSTGTTGTTKENPDSEDPGNIGSN